MPVWPTSRQIKSTIYTPINKVWFTHAVQKYASFLLGPSVDNDLNLGTHPGQTVGSALVSLCVCPCMNMCVCMFISLSETVWPLDWGQGELYSLFCAGTGFPVVNTTERFPGLPNPHTQTHCSHNVRTAPRLHVRPIRTLSHTYTNKHIHSVQTFN